MPNRRSTYMNKAYEAVLEEPPDGGVTDSGLWEATLLNPPHDIERADPTE